MARGLMIVVLTATSAVLSAVLTATPAPVVSEPAAPSAPALEDATYVGAKACKKCHFKQHKTWTTMKHASAWDVLSEEHRDPEQKDDKGRACISCHVTGWGEPGGFIDIASSEDLLGVGCEACHGAGSKHVELGQAMLKEKRKELLPGEEWFTELKTSSCSNCHNPHVNHEEFKK